MRALIVTPTYEEAENIAEFLERTRAAAPDADILVVDDDSPDGTADLAEEVGRRLGNIEVLRHDPVRVVVAQGLDPGDVVVTAGVQALRPGQKVRLLGAASLSARICPNGLSSAARSSSTS